MPCVFMCTAQISSRQPAVASRPRNQPPPCTRSEPGSSSPCRSFTIAAHGQFTDHFTLTVPTRVSSGQHLGAVVAAADVGVTAQGDPIEARAALIAVVTVPGAAHPSARLTATRRIGCDRGTGWISASRCPIPATCSSRMPVSSTIDDAEGHRVATLAADSDQRIRRAEWSDATCRLPGKSRAR